MHTPSFDPAFLRAMVVCRYVVYGYLLTVLLVQHLFSGAPPTYKLGYFLLTPLLLHFLLVRGYCQFRFLPWLHLLEFMFTWLVLLQHQPSLVASVAMAWLFVASNFALWGVRHGLLLVLLAIAQWFQVCPGCALMATQPTVDLLALAGGYVFMLVICVLAHQQAATLIEANRRRRADLDTLLQYLPADITEHMRHDAPGRCQRVWLSVAFVDLVGFTDASRELPEEILRELLNDFLGVTSSLVQQWGGLVSKFLGDGALCVFPAMGLDQRRNSAVQCVQFVRLLPAHLAAVGGRFHEHDQQQPLRVTIGVSSGFCTAGSWGAGIRWDYTVIGTPVNLASRLQGAAGKHGGLLLDDTTAGLVADHVPLSAPIALQLKGFAEQKAFTVCDSRLAHGQPPVGCKA